MAARASCRLPQRAGGNKGAIAFSLLVHTEQPLPTWLFLKKSRTSRRLPVQSRSEKRYG